MNDSNARNNPDEASEETSREVAKHAGSIITTLRPGESCRYGSTVFRLTQDGELHLILRGKPQKTATRILSDFLACFPEAPEALHRFFGSLDDDTLVTALSAMAYQGKTGVTLCATAANGMVYPVVGAWQHGSWCEFCGDLFHDGIQQWSAAAN